MRKVTDVAANRSDIERKVRKATSNKPYGPTGTQMAEIADATFNAVDFNEIMNALWKRLNEPGKYWRHVYKALVVLEYIIKSGAEQVVQSSKNNIYAIETLKDFQLIDKDDVDQGQNVRVKAKRIVVLLRDESELKAERAKANNSRERFNRKVNNDAGGHSGGHDDPEERERQQRKLAQKEAIKKAQEQEKEQLDAAIKASEEDYKKQKEQQQDQDLMDPDLQAALALSRAVSAKTEPSNSLEPNLSPFGERSASNPPGFKTSPYNNNNNNNSNRDPFGAVNNNTSDPFASTPTAFSQANSNDPFGSSSGHNSVNTSFNNSSDPFGGSGTTQPVSQTARAHNDLFGEQIIDPTPVSPKPVNPWDVPSTTSSTTASSTQPWDSPSAVTKPEQPAPSMADAWGNTRPVSSGVPEGWDFNSPNAADPPPTESTNVNPWETPPTKTVTPPPSNNPWDASSEPNMGGTPAHQMATIAKNSQQIDEFASVSSAGNLGGQPKDPWDMSNVNDALPSFPDSPKASRQNLNDDLMDLKPPPPERSGTWNNNKTKNLVNLDTLVISPTPKATHTATSGSTPNNPFALSGQTNPQPQPTSPMMGGMGMQQQQPMRMGMSPQMSPNMGMGMNNMNNNMGMMGNNQMMGGNQMMMGGNQQMMMGGNQMMMGGNPQMMMGGNPQMMMGGYPQMMGGGNQMMMGGNPQMMGGGNQMMMNNQMMNNQMMMQQQQQQQRTGAVLTPTKPS